MLFVFCEKRAFGKTDAVFSQVSFKTAGKCDTHTQIFLQN